MKCCKCEKSIRQGYKVNADVFCSKKCRYVFQGFDEYKITKERAYEDEACLEVQQDVFKEDLDFDNKWVEK